MTVTAPPRPPRPSDPVTHGEFEALVEALIEEAHQRKRRRRRRNGAIVALVALVGATLFALLGGGAQSQTSSTAPSARSSLVAAAANSHIAFISQGPPGSGGYCGVVYVMNPDGSGQRRLHTGWAATPDPRDCDQEGAPAWSPDGRQIAIAGHPDGTDNWGIYVMNADGSKLKRVTDGVGYDSGAAWSPDGTKIAFTTWRDRSVALAIVNADGSGQRMLTRNLAGTLAPSWSPDGRRIAFMTQRDSHRAVSVINADGSGQRMLTPITGRTNVPVWSPNGREIAFVSNWQVWVMNADGSGQRRLTHNGARNFAPAWSPNGQRIAFERRAGREEHGSCSGCGSALSFQVWVMSADGSEAQMLARRAARPVWSPDGRKIAFQYPVGPRGPGGLGKQTDIYVMNADGTGKRNLTRTPRNESGPVWSPAQR